MTTTPRKLAYDAYRLLGVLRPGQSTSEDAVDDAFRALNDLIDAWKIERLMVYTVAGTPYTVPPGGGGTFTLGPSGTLSQTAPVRVESASWMTAGMPGTPLYILTAEQWQRGQSGLYFDGRYPLTTMHVRPDANAGDTLTLYQWEPLSSFATADSCADLPPGYALALRYNLACQLYPMAIIQQKIPQSAYQVIEAKAMESKGAIKSFRSSPPPEMDGSAGLGCGCGYDVYSDRYY